MLLFEHITDNKFKIAEINLKDSSEFDITKIEEQQAFQYYKDHLLAEDVEDFNRDVGYRRTALEETELRMTTKKEVVDKMRKVYHGRARGILGSQIEYLSSIYKTETFLEIVFTLSISKEKVGIITLRYWHTFSPIALKKDLSESVIEPKVSEWKGSISKMEEEIAFNIIKRKWVPEAVIMWNKTHRKYKVSEEDVLRNLKKVRHDSKTERVLDDMIKWNRSDVIHYQYDVPGTKNSMTFMIHRFSNPFPYRGGWKDRSLMAGFFSGTALFEEPVGI